MNMNPNISSAPQDGSFLDHLTFCHDYGAVNYPSESPRVLFVHSIMGVSEPG